MNDIQKAIDEAKLKGLKVSGVMNKFFFTDSELKSLLEQVAEKQRTRDYNKSSNAFTSSLVTDNLTFNED